MGWARNVVRLPLKPYARDELHRQMLDFPPEFLLFVKHVHRLALNDDASDLDRNLELLDVDGECLLADGDTTSEWKLFKRTHELSVDAQADRRSLDDGDVVPIWWAAPLDGLAAPGQFWVFFPTKTVSLVAGILNAPWKTNEDRQNLLPGAYNEELMKAAAEMIADKLHELATNTDPARHLDALPRRHEAGDTDQVDLLRERLFSTLRGREIVPDQDGIQRVAKEISYPPKKLTPDRQMDLAPFDQWSSCRDRPSDWLHHRALTRNRLAAIDRMFPPRWAGQTPAAPRATIAEWLTALVEDRGPDGAARASMAAIQTAALIFPEIRSKDELGHIVLTTAGGWRAPDPDSVFLPDEAIEPQDGEQSPGSGSSVHSELASDSDTLNALKLLGIGLRSHESSLKLIANEVLNNYEEPSAARLIEFWTQTRKVGAVAADIIREHGCWRSELRVRTRSDDWRLHHSVLLPGKILPGDGSRDDDATVDVDFHEPDVNLLRNLGVTDAPDISRDLSSELWFGRFMHEQRNAFTSEDRKLPGSPRWDRLNFASTDGSGPLDVLTELSDEGRALYTDALLSLGTIHERWTLRHDTRDIYPALLCESPVVFMLREEGRIRTADGIVPFENALGRQPKTPASLDALLAHPKADKIKEAFDLAEPTPEFVGEEDPIPLTDVWPGLEEHLPAHRKTCQLIRCERIRVGSASSQCVFHAPDIYLARADDDDEGNELDELTLVADGFKLNLSSRDIEEILQRETRREIENRRAEIREYPTDAGRLLAAVGEQTIRQGLPPSLLVILENEGILLTGTEIAEAAIATYHSDALRQYRYALEPLNPPRKWAASKRAVNFVRSLGFSAEWAGERNRRRPPFLEIEGPYALPDLHDYQKTIITNVRAMLRNGRANSADRRGMISMPTGSGKTRVAVQAIVEAICHDDFEGGILWVADRDELCEQAVEAWRQVWSSIGTHASRMRVSRMWAGQPRPQPTSDLHVVVATIQTLNAKLSNQSNEYGFVADFKLVVFDEAHRSIASSFTSVMEEIGLTRWQREDEPFLLGLTATPYRGHNEEETARLVGRFGSNRLDAGAFGSDDPQDVIGELQDMRVLARADQEPIVGGVFSLDIEELLKMASTPWLPQSVEDRIAADSARTKRIVEAYETHIDPDWPTLVFATSVEHAKTMAALLNARGIKSRAVSGDTEASTRRRVVEEFRHGGIKALVNYGVFREGFDAPKTRAIIVARPVYSPNLYFQMVGRGLRGVKNGGNDRCLILNVQDNIENFQQALAFSDLDWLWA